MEECGFAPHSELRDHTETTCGRRKGAPTDNERAIEESSGETTGQENARRSAESYLEMSAFSRNGLIKQLSSQYGEGFTHAQAVYGVNQTGL